MTRKHENRRIRRIIGYIKRIKREYGKTGHPFRPEAIYFDAGTHGIKVYVNARAKLKWMIEDHELRHHQYTRRKRAQ